MRGSNLAQAATNLFWVDPIYRNTRNEASHCPYFVTTKGGQEHLLKQQAMCTHSEGK